MQVQRRREKPNIKAARKLLTKVSRHPRASKSIFLLASMALQLAAQQYVVNTVAGGGPGPEPATNAGLNISGLAMDQAGNVYFTQYSRVFKVDPSGNLSVVAGNWMVFNGQTSGGDGGPATQAVIGSASAVTVDASGNIFFVDSDQVRKIAASTGIITTVYPSGETPSDLAVDAQGNLYVANRGCPVCMLAPGVDVIAPNGTISSIAGVPPGPIGAVGVDNSGAVYVGSYNGSGNSWTYRVINGQSSLYNSGHWIVRFDSNGNGYAPDSNTNQVLRYAPGGQSFTVVAGNGQAGFSGDGGSATVAELNQPELVAVQPNGKFVLFDLSNFRIREVSNGVINTIAGNGLSNYGGDNYPGGTAQLMGVPHYITLDANSNLYFSDQTRIRKVDATRGIVSTVAGNGGYPPSPDGTPALQASIQPFGVALDFMGTIYFAQNGALKKISAGFLSTALPAPGPCCIRQLAVDGTGNLYYGADYELVVKVAVNSHALTTLAGSGSSNPIGGVSALTVDRAGTFVYFVDTSGGVLKKVPADGGAASIIASGFTFANGLAIDLDGSLLVSDSSNNIIQRVTVNGSTPTLTTIAGTGVRGFNGDGMLATATQFGAPQGVAVDSAGRILVDDIVNGRIRSLTPATAVTVATSPSGLNIVVDGVGVVAPQTYGWIPGSMHTIAVPAAQLLGNAPYTFTGWSDGGALSHNVTATASAVTYTAMFNATVCTFGLGSTITSVSSAGANSSVAVSASALNCPWTAISNVSWIATSATGTGDGTAGFTVAADVGTARSGTITIAGQMFTVNQAGAAAATLSLNASTLRFGTTGQQITGPQLIALSFSPAAAVAWTASSNTSNITVSPSSGMGSAQLQIMAAPGSNGVITLTAPGAANSPQHVQVNVVTVTPGNPYGSFDTPATNITGIAGAIPVTGWALDNIEVSNVGIWREPVAGEANASNGLVFIGNAVFVAGARPDVQAAYPNAPLNYTAGWGYMLLTNFLPNASGSGASGNGTYRLHAIVTNLTGQTLDLGTHTITVDNAHATKPFGTIDTPAQGGTVAGNAYVNFGWALTQNPYVIRMDGSTINVFVDGVPVGHPTYNQYRSDIASLFRGLANSNGAVGFFYLDTTTLANGVHTIAWSVSDNVGRGDGIGSRYFTVANTGASNAPASEGFVDSGSDQVVVLRRGFDTNRDVQRLTQNQNGEYLIRIEELDRIELSVGTTSGHLLVNGVRLALPVGSSLTAGTFYWNVGPGFLGEYEFEFERSGKAAVRVRVRIQPKQYH